MALTCNWIYSQYLFYTTLKLSDLKCAILICFSFCEPTIKKETYLDVLGVLVILKFSAGTYLEKQMGTKTLHSLRTSLCVSHCSQTFSTTWPVLGIWHTEC